MTKLALLMLFIVFIVITVIVWIIHFIKHKKKAPLAIISCLTVLVISFCVIFPTSFPFVDSAIIGKSKDEIIDMYGEGITSELTSGSKMEYFIGVDQIFGGLIRNDKSHDYYCIYFDNNDIAKRIKVESMYVSGRRCILRAE